MFMGEAWENNKLSILDEIFLLKTQILIQILSMCENALKASLTITIKWSFQYILYELLQSNSVKIAGVGK